MIKNTIFHCFINPAAEQAESISDVPRRSRHLRSAHKATVPIACHLLLQEAASLVDTASVRRLRDVPECNKPSIFCCCTRYRDCDEVCNEHDQSCCVSNILSPPPSPLPPLEEDLFILQPASHRAKVGASPVNGSLHRASYQFSFSPETETNHHQRSLSKWLIPGTRKYLIHQCRNERSRSEQTPSHPYHPDLPSRLDEDALFELASADIVSS